MTGLRSAIARYLHGLHNPDRFWQAEWADHTQDYAAADAVLALPALRDVLAAAARDAEKVRELRKALADLTESVSRGDEYGLPEAYRAASVEVGPVYRLPHTCAALPADAP